MISVPQVTESLQRILVFFFPEPKEQIGYITSIHEAIATSCTPEIFDRACQIVAETMRPGKKPVPSEYLDAIRGIQSLAPKHSGPCDRCNGYKMIPGRQESQLYGKSIEVMLPCPVCQKR